MNDPLDEFLNRTAEPADDRLRREILEKTMRVLRRRRFTRTLSITAALAACFLVGVGAGGWLLSTNTVVSVPVYVSVPATNDNSQQAASAPDALAKENQAFDARENRAAFYFEAGRKYLREARDYDSALRCYRLALDLAKADALAVSVDDDWLLMSLKQARRKENHDAVLN